MPAIPTSISDHFKNLPDPRIEGRSRHLLIDIITMVLCAVIGGADTFDDINLFAQEKEEWFRSFLELPGGIPSHDTFNRVMSMILPEEFSKCFTSWAQTLAGKIGGVVAIDGKTLRRSFDSASKRSALHMVSAFCSESGMVLGQVRTAAKSNEITAIPELIRILDLEGTVVTIDAMGCQKAIAQEILDAGADYVLALKGNQGSALDFVKTLFTWEEKNDYRGVFHTFADTTEKDHGRIEKREVVSVEITDEMDILREWPGLKSVTRVASSREMPGGERTEERRYYLSSMSASAVEIGGAVRAHWGIENSLHWSLDVTFREDWARHRKGYSGENMSFIRRMAMNLLKKEQSSKLSLRRKRLKATWSNEYILKLISHL